ncbi:PIN domain nuclease [Uniformispora flossi]|uniref:PIN domain nuclease n=1 Tax=Uniformispora flossi TaxID=3390723 RepID=UPI003C2DA273
MTDSYLLDTSALQRRAKPQARLLLDELSERGGLAVCGPVEMEVMYSARNVGEALRMREWLRGFDHLPMPDEVWDRAIDVRHLAVAKGIHRALSLPDLLIAATAERHGVTVLHYDGDYDMIAAITGQPMRWIAPPGTAD